jgi:hypothetical protein
MRGGIDKFLIYVSQKNLILRSNFYLFNINPLLTFKRIRNTVH